MLKRAFNKEHLSILVIILFILTIDQVTKFIAMEYLRPIRSIPVMGNFFRLTYVENSGMAFGIQIDNKLIFNVLSILAVIIIFYYLFKLRNHTSFRTSFAIILGGAFGNLTDRFFRGRVIDFLDVEFFDIHFSGGNFLMWELPAYTMYRWPVFNIADLAVSLGMVIIIIAAFIEDPPQTVVENAVREEV
ncbi:signal peptidase II [Candidatus Saccharibacteria bacterium]|nr:signal peptidase II [Candidatus Saccharibacteria bacterium]NIW79108.1 signal peptidase II [Calditrichia bacterium]